MRDGQFIVDADGHVMDLDQFCYRRYLPEEWRRRPNFFPNQGWDRNQAPQGERGRCPETPEQQLADIDLEGIDLQIVFPTVGLNIGEVREPVYQAALCRAYNNWVADFCGAAPDRLKAVAIVPVLDADEACRELNRAVTDLGLVGMMFPTFLRGRNAGDKQFWPIYAEAERLGIPVAFHAGGSETGDVGRFGNFLGVHIWSHVPEQMISLTSCLLAGLPEAFPTLRLGFMESGAGWVPFWMEHMDGEVEKRPWDAPGCKSKPSEYMRGGQIYFGCEPEERTIPYVAQWVGEGALLYASDYPHWDSEWPHTVGELWERDDVSPGLKQKIMCDNALRFYGLKAPVLAS